MSATTPTSKPDISTESTQSEIEKQILAAVREVKFGFVEIVVHDRRVTEIRQTRRTRLID
ncbi:MAG: hypothetical protein BGO12_00625 [Verrucomicrobia bacterium 61-8]|nr:DUF2292 domain-containing protein [Verrucomicrobiota bacterium]OJV04282.1 MAG: hypothetical protein BGO12_00625 [Verrucomicrobia bacterium 61-8]